MFSLRSALSRLVELRTGEAPVKLGTHMGIAAQQELRTPGFCRNREVSAIAGCVPSVE